MAIIIFDFDGTIADTLDVVLKIINRSAEEFGITPLQPEDVKRFQNLSSREVVRQAEVPLFKLPFLLKRIKTELNREIHQLKLIPGMGEVLATLREQGHHLGIVTSNSHENVTTFLNIHNLASLFDFIHSGTTIFGKGRIIARILREKQLDPQEVVYVGDETRDIEAARKIAVKVVAVGWGFNSTQALAAENPDCLIHEPHELINVIDRLQQKIYGSYDRPDCP